MLRKIGTAILCFLFISMLLWAGWTAYSEAREYERKTGELTDRLHTMPKVKNLLRKAGEFITLGIYNGYSKEVKDLNEVIAAAARHKKRATVATIAFFVLSGISLLFIYVVISDKAFFIGTMLLISSVALTVGLSAPILMIVTYKDIAVLGKVVFLFQSKGIITTIETLFTSGNIPVAIPLFLFSVMIPFLKTLIMGLALLGPGQSLASQSLCMIRRIGKWSMADVFVVALLLTYFTVNKDRLTNAEVQIGLYFFLGYVILSMIASLMLTHQENVSSPKFKGYTLFIL